MRPTSPASRASTLHKSASDTASNDRSAARAGRTSCAEGSIYNNELANVEALRGDDEDELGSRFCEQRAREQRIGSAIETSFAAALCLLGRRGLLRDSSTQTVGQLRRTVRRSGSPASEPFGILCALLTPTIYADAPVNWNDWERARAAYEQLVRSAERADAA